MTKVTRNLDAYELKQICREDTDLIKDIYYWQNSEIDKPRYCVDPVPKGKMPCTEEGLASFLKHFDLHFCEKDPPITHYILILKETGEALGMIMYSNYNPRNYNAEIGFYFPEEHRHKGYGKILMELFLRTVFHSDHQPCFHKLWAETGAFNTASLRLMEHFGFHRDGTIREHYWLDGGIYDQYIYTLLRKEYLENNPSQTD
ncbi:MAG: GNAT family protein [Candidatus Cloacimonadota bacterium]